MKRKSLLLLFLVSILTLSSFVLRSEDEEHERREHEGRKREGNFVSSGRDVPVVTNAKWKTECSSCHMLYLPGLLPARSWTKMMDGLDKHFGENAGLDAATKKEITDFLVQNSSDNSPSRRGGKILSSIGKSEAPLRISETTYFVRKHDEIRASTYKRKAIGSAANCIACHGGAELGDFSEHGVRIPKEGEVPVKKK